jgi:threonine dehydratase
MTASARPAPRPAKRAPSALTPADYLKKILTARVYDVAVESPLEPARRSAPDAATRCC